MKSYRVFDIIGPRMIGPSSSHTAGAVRLGGVAYRLLGGDIVRARVTLYGSFAKTGRGHGTDRAIVGGLLGLEPDDDAVLSCDLALAGIESLIPFDEVVSAVAGVGAQTHADLRETARGGLAATPTAQRLARELTETGQGGA